MEFVPVVKAASVGGDGEHPNPVRDSMQCGKQVKRDEGGGKEAGKLYLAAALSSKSSRTGFDISLRLETKMNGSVSFCKRRGVSAQRKEPVEEQQPRGGVLGPVAAEAESSLRFSLVFI
ncbi:hypothetical protein D4764_10G0003640 [Takifugu flavidus]|uniref:Uncharacterized protein n=1 Tax=Takifugu flavidus TaxID=433684 RepID=A0A5C6PHR7_9TELE|nr:hypothetical protein D4764_10G0003640 [Takifugu flavidus]